MEFQTQEELNVIKALLRDPRTEKLQPCQKVLIQSFYGRDLIKFGTQFDNVTDAFLTQKGIAALREWNKTR